MAAGDTSAAAVTRFEFATAQRILFGAGTAQELPALVRPLGKRVFAITGANTSRHESLLRPLLTAEARIHRVRGEPTVDQVDGLAAEARELGADVVVAIGGGAAIDAAKAVAALVTNYGHALDYLEVVGRGQPLEHPALPIIAVPTTAGTGAEVTRNAVLSVPAAQVKASLRSPYLLPRVALVDPQLTLSLPRDVTAATGMDALTQLIEAFLTPRATPMTDALCRAALPGLAGALRRVMTQPDDLAARSQISLAALHSGMALANAGLGAVHGFAAVIGGRFAAPHGAICAALLPPVLEMNLRALHSRQPTSPSLDKLNEVARWLTERSDATADDCTPACAALALELGIPPLRQWGVNDTTVSAIAAETVRASSTKANPIAVSADELASALRAAL